MNLKRFLVSMGYLDKAQKDDPEAVRKALRKAQRFYHIKPTGDLDNVTKRVIGTTPRCGFPDFHAARGQLLKWGKSELTYKQVDFVTGAGLTKADNIAIVRDGFDAVSAVCGLKFTSISSQAEADLVIFKGRGRRVGLDGPGGTLAYAYLPYSGNHTEQLSMVLDMDEAWWTEPKPGRIALMHVFIHELLHNLGLDHDNTPEQLMNPIYNPAIGLPMDNDIRRLVRRYDEAVAPPPGGNGDVPELLKIEQLIRINGRIVLGPYNLDLSKRRSRASL